MAEGKKTMLDRVVAETDRILQTHEPKPLDEKVHAEMKKIVEDADRRHS